jgi:undecaprenyl-diphosphatase
MLEYINLGIIQGIAEFLPISSKAHLVIFQKIFGINLDPVAITAVMHLGTTLAIILFFFKDILKLLRDIKSLALILIVTIITAFIGFFCRELVGDAFSKSKIIGLGLIVTGLVLISTKYLGTEREELNWKDALMLGLAQGLSILPGISRAGITISVLMLRKIDRDTSFRFSYIASIPIVIGVNLLEIKNIQIAFTLERTNLLIGVLMSFLVGLFSLFILKTVFIQKGKIYIFGYYCLLVAAVIILFLK